VRGIKDLRLVSVTAQTIAADKGSYVLFEMYYQLLMSAATIYDVEQGEKQNSRRRRNINFTDVSDDLEDEDHDDVSFLGPAEGYLDLPPQQFIQLNQHKLKKFSGKTGKPSGKSSPSNPGFDPHQVACVPSELWHKLPPEIQAMLQEHN
jgi:hypothetical protein